jgi:anaerobic magnesium-protoporphyrin IX monomethyl ester cyclase
MKVVLVNPPLLKYFRSYPVPPLGLAYLAAKVRREHEITVFDLNVEPVPIPRLVKKIVGLRPDLVGLTATTPTFSFQLDLARSLKLASGLPVLMGGNHITALPLPTLADPAVDYVIAGEGEQALASFLREFAPGRKDYQVPGLGYRGPAGGPCFNPPAAPLEDIDRLPFPAWDLLPMKKYRSRFRQLCSVILSRGCPFSCTYCAAHLTHGKKIRRRGLDSIMAELKELRHRHDVSFVTIFDDTFTLDRDFAAAFCERMIKEVPGLEFWCNTRVDRVDPELLKLMRRAGCVIISYGIESGTDHVLEQVHKGITVEQTRQAVGWTREAGIIPEGFFMINFPGESERDMEATAAFALDLRLPFYEIISATPYPGTQYERTCRENGLLPPGPPRDYSNYWVIDDVVVHNGIVPRERVRAIMADARRRMILRPVFFTTLASYLFQGARPTVADLKYYPALAPRLIREMLRHFRSDHDSASSPRPEGMLR